MGLPDATSRTLYRVREAEVPDSSATITVMKKISFRSILFRPSYCARPIRSHYFKPLCYRWNRPILSAALTMETNRKPSRIVIRKYGESHQEPCSGSPFPILHWLAGSTFANGPQEQETADRIWGEIPVLVAPLQERIRRLPACLTAVEQTVSPARIDWALDELQRDLGDRWWRDLDGRDPFWLERVYTDCMRHPSAAAKGHADA